MNLLRPGTRLRQQAVRARSLSSVAWTPSSLPGLVWDSGEDPAVGSAVPGSVSVSTAACEVWCVSRGHIQSVVDLGNGSQAMYYADTPNAATASKRYLFDGGIKTLRSNTYLTRVSPSISGWRGNGANSFVGFENGITYSAVAGTTTTVTGGTVGKRTTSGGFAWVGDVRRIIVFSANLSAGNRTLLLSYLRTRYGVQAYSTQVVGCGDSLTAGYNSVGNVIASGWTGGDYTWSYLTTLAAAHTDWKVFNHGVTSKTINSMTTDDTTGVDPYYDATNFARNVVVVFAGTNDVYTDAVSLATLQTRVTTYCAARKSAGWKVVYVPMLDRTQFDAGMRTIKDDFNTWLSGGGLGANADALVTLPTELAGNSPWVTYPTYWDNDNIHLSRTGYQSLAAAVGTAVEAV